MTRRVIAVEFDAPVGPARELARQIEELAGQVDGNAITYTQGFRPIDWPRSEAVITIDE